MQWSSVGAVLGALLLAGTHAMAASPLSQASINRRLLSECMSKQMTASKTISYNEASRVCKSQLKSQNLALSARNVIKPANAR